jgi:hypothetical protein
VKNHAQNETTHGRVTFTGRVVLLFASMTNPALGKKEWRFQGMLLVILSSSYSFHKTSYKKVPREELASVPHLASLRP